MYNYKILKMVNLARYVQLHDIENGESGTICTITKRSTYIRYYHLKHKFTRLERLAVQLDPLFNANIYIVHALWYTLTCTDTLYNSMFPAHGQ